MKTPGPAQRTNAWVNSLLSVSLAFSAVIEVWALDDWEPCYHRSFPLGVPAGLESALIQRIEPPWNVAA